jgi:CelD/BcsL family acetyltransferase involved in cellulose biosynthesis
MGAGRSGVMKVSAVRAAELSSGDRAHWAALLAGNRRLDSPFFRPEFAEAVGSIQPRAEVGVIEDGSKVVGYFPYERHSFGIGKPIATYLSDFQGLVGAVELNVDAEALLAGCRLNAWDFDHQLASQPTFEAFATVEARSPFIDLAAGVDDYVAASRRAGSQNVSQIRRKARQLVAARGPLRFEAHTTQPDVWRQTLEWKRDQYRRTGVRDVLASEKWATTLLARIREQCAPAFAGMVSALYAGDALVAGHVGMRSETVWHYWFPAFDPACAAFSPGSILLLRMIEHAPELGITRIDLGKGEARYKSRFMNGAVALIEGRVERESAVIACRRAARGMYHWARMTAPARVLRRVRHGAQ